MSIDCFFWNEKYDFLPTILITKTNIGHLII